LRLYRLVHGADAPFGDFLSDEAKGREKRREQLTDERLYRGISMFSSAITARRIQRQVPQLGRWLAILDLPEVGYIEIHKTRGPDHYTVIGLPLILRQHVVAIERLR